MTRTRANALVLVNWKGVFYERYLLDRYVTALEGANGAGKTTVMIAAYVVLLPDMSRLRFTNIGETWASGGDKGIWGRLGEPGRPSYAALDFALAGSRRLIAGVHLARKGEPSVEPTPFVVTGLGEDVRLQDLMLIAQGTREAVPELTELRENAARLGGRLLHFTSARDYFSWLFDQGVTPLRLGTEEERTKLNEMLRTSMTGGISRTLTTELRSFLLREEGGLADTLQRMRANLDACRRTRTEVQESQRLEREIGGVFEAGQTMFVAAFLATRERADELQRRVADAEAKREATTTALHDAESALSRAIEELASAESLLQAAEAAHRVAMEWLTRLRGAIAAAANVARHRETLESAETVERLEAQERAKAEQAREAQRDELKRAQENHKRAAEGLSNLERGVEQLYRRAGAHRHAMRRRRQAEELLGISELRADELTLHLGQCRNRLAESDRERREGGLRLADASNHREAFEKASKALRTLTGGARATGAPHAVALEALRRQRELRALAERIPSLLRELSAARVQANHQVAVRERAAKLGVVPGDQPASSQVRTLLENVEVQQQCHQEDARTAQANLIAAERALADLRARRQDLAEKGPLWRELDAMSRRLSGAVPFPVVDRPTLERARALVSERLAAAKSSEEELAHMRERLLSEARELLAAEGPFNPELLRLKDELNADFLAARFEDVGIEEAGLLEAKLGPLAQALVVEEPLAAAQFLETRSNTPSSVWLVAQDGSVATLGDMGSHHTGAPVVLVNEGLALRVSRIPERPRLGRRAREKRAAELHEEAHSLESKLEEERTHRRGLERLMEDGDALLAEQALWLAGDPTIELGAVHRRVVETETQAEQHRRAAAQCAEAARMLQASIDGLRGLMGEAFLLDLPDQGTRVAQLDEEYKGAIVSRAEVARCADATRILEESLDVLRHPVLSEAELNALRRRVEERLQERDRLETVIEALEDVSKNIEALDWADAVESLKQNEALVPALRDQLRKAEAAVGHAQQAAEDADEAYLAATSRWQDADGHRRAAHQQFKVSEEHFLGLGVPDPSAEAEQGARSEVDRLEAEVAARMRAISELSTERGRREAARDSAAAKAKEAEDKVAIERREAAPAVERWERLHDRVSQHHLLASVRVPNESNLSGIRGHVNLVQEAQRQRLLLVERLRTARDGQELLTRAQAHEDTSDLAFADIYLEFWILVRDWLRRRLPAQIAEVDDPREALVRLREQLATLEERLNRQETDLRGASEDVARGIDVHIRKARGQVQRLNTHLTGVSFGSIQGVRVRLQPVEQMEQVLRALREGAAQGLLFQQDLPIEDALDEIFRRYGGGRTGGPRLLDYREYVHLSVEIRRNSRAEWESANPTRLSTGEAIGVGAALMMVVLTEWERDANLLREKRSAGSLRFLFLDEANRLSQDNLAVLFGLCQTLDLQLLIAAPEVARAEGNTTYRLVRRATEDGREEVVVSGRRTRAEA